MTTALVKWFEPESFSQAMELSRVLAGAQIVPDAYKNRPNDVMACLMLGQTLGLSPMQALLGINVIKGKPGVSSQLAYALLLGSPLVKEIICTESTDQKCTFRTTRVTWPAPKEVSWTIEEAKRANLINGDNWRNYPADMLRNRCVMRLARTHYPDVIGGLNVKSADEIEDELVEVTTAPPPPSAAGSITPDAVFVPVRKADEVNPGDKLVAADGLFVKADPPPPPSLPEAPTEPAQTRAGALGRAIMAAINEELLKDLGKAVSVAHRANEISDTEARDLFGLCRSRTEDVKRGNV